MDLSYSEQQEMLKRAARDFLARECPKSLVREMEQDAKGVPLGLWKKMGEMGWLGLLWPEQYEGAGQSYLDFTVLLEEMGRALVPGPVLHTVVSCGMAILEHGTEAQRRRFLPGIARGETLMALAYLEPDTSYDEVSVSTRAKADNGGYRLTGIKRFVPHGNSVDYLLVAARTEGRKNAEEGVTLLLVDARSPGIEMRPLPTRSRDKAHEVTLKDVAALAENVLGKAGQGWPLFQRIRTLSAAAQCAEIVGMLGAIAETTVEYAKKRVQFGRPIGSFQAVQRHCVDLTYWADACRYMTYEAAWRLSAGLAAEREVGLAKSYVADASRQAIESAHQAHGAIGLTEEHDLVLYNRRMTSAAVNFGGAAFYREMAARAMGL